MKLERPKPRQACLDTPSSVDAYFLKMYFSNMVPHARSRQKTQDYVLVHDSDEIARKMYECIKQGKIGQ